MQKGTLWYLAPISFSFKLIVLVRHALFNRGILKEKKAPLPVVSVGNIVAGGVGKTPVVLKLATLLGQKYKVAVVSRGYGAKGAKRASLLVTNTSSPSKCGDEPCMLAKRLPNALVLVGKNRYQSCLVAKQLGAEVVLLDDGLQHRHLQRDIELVVVQGDRPYGTKSFLPQGTLRDVPSRLEQADLILAQGALPKLDAEAPVVGLESVVEKVVCFERGETLDVSRRKVATFCAIANPGRFTKTVEQLGATVVQTYCLSDHEKIGEKKLKKLALEAKAKGAKAMLCTEKDWIKLKDSPLCSPLPLAYVKIDLQVISNGNKWNEMLTTIETKIGNTR